MGNGSLRFFPASSHAAGHSARAVSPVQGTRCNAPDTIWPLHLLGFDTNQNHEESMEEAGS